MNLSKLMKVYFDRKNIDIEELSRKAKHKVKSFKKEAWIAISKFNDNPHPRGNACAKLLLNISKRRDISSELMVHCIEFCKSVLDYPQGVSHKKSDKKYQKIKSKFVKRIGDAEHLPVIQTIISFMDGYHLENQELFVLALDNYLKAAQDFPNEYIWHIIGDLYVKNENIEKAVEAYDQALKYNPKEVNNYLCLGDYYLIGKKDEDKALEQYNKAWKECREDEDIESLNYNLAALGEYFSARACGDSCNGGISYDSQIANQTLVEEFYRKRSTELPAFITLSPENKNDVMAWAIDCFKRSNFDYDFRMRSIIFCYFELEDYKNVIKFCQKALDDWNEWMCPNNWCGGELGLYLGLFEDFARWKGYAKAKLKGSNPETDMQKWLHEMKQPYIALKEHIREDGNRTRFAVYGSKEETNKLLQDLQDLMKDLRVEVLGACPSNSPG